MSVLVIEDLAQQQAYLLADYASRLGEVPVGAVVLYQNRIIAKGFNQKEMHLNSMYHAEIIALIQASQYLKNWRLNECIMVVSLEPCRMCACILDEARIQKIIFGAKRVQQKKERVLDSSYSYPIEYREHLESSQILKQFFMNQRKIAV